uniref:Uncharacterized protein n=1 Tax=Oryza glumipatula TaxID=40148 RepID=A0A0E0BUX2_9ORYZ
MLLAWLAGRPEEYLWEVGSGVGKAAAVAARWRWQGGGGLGGDPLKAEGEHGGGGGGLDLEVVVLAEDVLCYGLDAFGVPLQQIPRPCGGGALLFQVSSQVVQALRLRMGLGF